jgi:hypothetical protein
MTWWRCSERPGAPIDGEIVADFEETRQFWNFTMSEIKLDETCCLFKDVTDDNTFKPERTRLAESNSRCTLLRRPN